jgi:hypothetical protein
MPFDHVDFTPPRPHAQRSRRAGLSSPTIIRIVRLGILLAAVAFCAWVWISLAAPLL